MRNDLKLIESLKQTLIIVEAEIKYYTSWKKSIEKDLAELDVCSFCLKEDCGGGCRI